MRRTPTRAKSRTTTVSALVHEAVRERYFGRHEEQMKAMWAFVGIREDVSSAPDTDKYVRGLRSGSGLDQLHRE